MKTLTSNFIHSHGLRLHYLRRPADGPTILLLHGLTDGGIYWTPVIEALNDDYDVVAPDARGHGLSDAPATGYSAQDHADDVAALVQALGLRRPIVMGHSMGGMVATAFVAQHPEFAHAAIFEDPAWLAAEQMQSAEIRTQRADDWRRDLQATQALTPAEQIVKCRAEHPLWSDGEVQLWAITKQQARVQVLEYIEHPPMDWRALVAAIQCPALLITGDAMTGVIISPQLAHEAQALNAHLRVAQVSDAGHSIHRDNFAGYMAAVNAFLQSMTHSRDTIEAQ